MNRNDIYEYTLGNRRCRIVIVSATPFNPRRATFAVISGPDTEPPVSVVAVPLAAADPARGTINLTRLRVLDPESVGARIGRLSASTAARVNTGLQAYLDL